MASNETTRAAGAAGNVFTVRGLGFAYGGRAAGKGGAAVGGRGTRIFDGLDLDIREGVVTTLIGANGSGKSTLFNLLTKNLKPQAGGIFLRSGDVSALRLKDFAKLVAIVHQRNSAPGDLSVEKLVGYGRYPFQGLGQKRDADEDERMVAWALETTGLSELADAPVASLSGGQAQRAWIAMVLAQETAIMLLDEPTTWLDISHQIDLLELLSELNREKGYTLAAVLHDLNQACRYASHLIALREGKIVAQGAPKEIVTAELIERIYGLRCMIIDDPVAGTPLVVPLGRTAPSTANS